MGLGERGGGGGREGQRRNKWRPDERRAAETLYTSKLSAIYSLEDLGHACTRARGYCILQLLERWGGGCRGMNAAHCRPALLIV